MLKDSSIAKRLGLGFGILIFLIILTYGFNIFSQYRMSSNLKDIEERFQKVKVAGDLNRLVKKGEETTF